MPWIAMRNLIRLLTLICTINTNCFADSNKSPAKISLDEATKQIIEGTYNKVLGAQTEMIDNKDVYVIKALTPDGRIQYFKIDAETGQMVNQPHD